LSFYNVFYFPDGPGLADTRMSPFWILLELRMIVEVNLLCRFYTEFEVFCECWQAVAKKAQ